jgi:hypothetical protein
MATKQKCTEYEVMELILESDSAGTFHWKTKTFLLRVTLPLTVTHDITDKNLHSGVTVCTVDLVYL